MNKKEEWTSSDGRLAITVVNNGRGLLAVLTMCGETYNGFVASTINGHHVMFFPRLGLHGKWGVPCLYDLTDDLGNRYQWLYDSDRYRQAVDELNWAIRYGLMITDPINSYKGYSIVKENDDLYPFIVSEFVCLNRADNSFTCRFKSLSAAKAAVTRYLSCLQL